MTATLPAENAETTTPRTSKRHCSVGSIKDPNQIQRFRLFWVTEIMQNLAKLKLHQALHMVKTSSPFDLLAKVHSSLEEGKAMGVSFESIMKYREDYVIPNSDAFEATPGPSRRCSAKQLGGSGLGQKFKNIGALEVENHLLQKCNACRSMYIDNKNTVARNIFA